MQTSLRNSTKISRILDGKEYQTIHIGCSNTEVLRVIGKGERQYLKIQAGDSLVSFQCDVDAIGWLEGRVNVPRVLDHDIDGDFEYLLMTEVAGKNCCELQGKMASRDITACLAEGLREIHAIPIGDCPFDQTVEAKLAGARVNLEHNLVDEGDFDQRRQGSKGSDVYRYLVDNRPQERHLVFGHGDYCLPNVLISRGKVSGFVDLGRSGVCDIYNDLAIASRRIVHNLGLPFTHKC